MWSKILGEIFNRLVNINKINTVKIKMFKEIFFLFYLEFLYLVKLKFKQ